MANTVDVVQARLRKKRRRRLGKLLIVVFVAAVCAFIYSKRNVWFPKLENIGTKYQNITQNENADAEGYFPLSVSGGVDFYAEFIESSMFILCDKYLYIYGTDGSLKDSRQHAYSNAIIKTNDSRSLVYSHGGTNFRVDTPGKKLYEVTMDSPIQFAAIGKNNYVAIVTESSTYACRLSVYDASGKLVYTRDCVERLLDVSIYEKGCILATLGADDGDLTTTLQYISFEEEGVKWSTEPFPTLCLHVYALADGGALVIGDTRCAYYSSTGALLSTYDYTGTLTDFAFDENRAAVLLKNEQRRKSELILLSEPSAAPVCVSFDTIAKGVAMDGDTAYLLNNASVTGYAFSGEQMTQTPVEDAYESVIKHGKYFYLLGYDMIDRVSVK